MNTDFRAVVLFSEQTMRLNFYENKILVLGKSGSCNFDPFLPYKSYAQGFAGTVMGAC